MYDENDDGRVALELIRFMGQEARRHAKEVGPEMVAFVDMIPHFCALYAIWYRRNSVEGAPTSGTGQKRILQSRVVGH